MNALVFDTAGPVIGVGLRDDRGFSQRIERVNRGSEARLVPWAVELAAERDLALAELDGIGVTVGPGAFTGLRVGLASAQGLALALGKPLFAVDSLMPRARRVGGRVLVMLDARKGRVYGAVHDGTTLLQPPADVDPDTAIAWMGGRAFVATGEGALVYADRIVAAGGTIADGADDPSIEALAGLTIAGLTAGEGVDACAVAPLYLRDPDAVPVAAGR